MFRCSREYKITATDCNGVYFCLLLTKTVFHKFQPNRRHNLSNKILKFQIQSCLGTGTAQRDTLFLHSLLDATSWFSVFIDQKSQLTGWDNGNNMRNATCAAQNLSGPIPDSLYCAC